MKEETNKVESFKMPIVVKAIVKIKNKAYKVSKHDQEEVERKRKQIHNCVMTLKLCPNCGHDHESNTDNLYTIVEPDEFDPMVIDISCSECNFKLAVKG